MDGEGEGERGSIASCDMEIFCFEEGWEWCEWLREVLERGGRGGRDLEGGFCSLLWVKEILALE